MSPQSSKVRALSFTCSQGGSTPLKFLRTRSLRKVSVISPPGRNGFAVQSPSLCALFADIRLSVIVGEGQETMPLGALIHEPPCLRAPQRSMGGDATQTPKHRGRGGGLKHPPSLPPSGEHRCQAVSCSVEMSMWHQIQPVATRASLEAEPPASTVSLPMRPQPWLTAQLYPRERPKHPAKLPPDS